MTPDMVTDLENRMAELASRIATETPAERRYASVWLDRLWTLHSAATENA